VGTKPAGGAALRGELFVGFPQTWRLRSAPCLPLVLCAPSSRIDAGEGGASSRGHRARGIAFGVFVLGRSVPVFSRVAIVNRGEAAMRLIHAVRDLSAQTGTPVVTVALYTYGDGPATFVREADLAYLLGPASA